MRWIIVDLPVWVTGCVLIIGLPVLAVGLKVLFTRKLKWLTSTAHNDVAGFQAALVAVVYAVVVGFTIVSLYEASVTASTDISTEAADLLQLHVGDTVLGPSTSARIDADVVRYARAIVDNWQTTAEGHESADVQRSLNDIYSTLDAYRPHTEAQTDFLNESVADLDQLSQARVARQLEAQESGSLPLVLWVAILLTSVMALVFALMFSLESLTLTCTMVASVTAVLAVNLFVLVEFGYPFIGPVSAGPGKFVDVIHLIMG